MEPKRRGFRNLAAKLSRLVEKTSSKHQVGGSTTTAESNAGFAEVDLPSAVDCARFDDLELGVITKLYAELLSRSQQPVAAEGVEARHGIDKATFLEYFQLPGLWADGLFKMFTNGTVVTFANFVHGLSACCRGTKTERVGILFKLFDMNDDGVVSKDELTAMLSNVPLLNTYMQTTKPPAALSRTHSKTTVLTDVRKTDDSASSGREMSSLGWAFEEEVEPLREPGDSSDSSAAFDDSDDDTFNDKGSLLEPSPMVTEMLARVRRDEAVETESNDLEALVSDILEQYDACGSECLDLDSFRLFVDHHPAILKLFSDCLREDVWSLKGHALGRAVHKAANEHTVHCHSVEQWISVRKQFIKSAPRQVQPPIGHAHSESGPEEMRRGSGKSEAASGTSLSFTSLPNTAATATSAPAGELETDVSYFLGLSPSSAQRNSGTAGRTRRQIELNCPSCLAPLVICPQCDGRFPDLKIQRDDVYVVCRSCNKKSSECWICNYKFKEALHSAASEFQMQGDLYSNDGLKLHFLLADRMLYYFEKDGDKVPSGFIFLEGCYVEPLGQEGGVDVGLSARTARRTPVESNSETAAGEDPAEPSRHPPSGGAERGYRKYGFCIIPSKVSEKKKTLYALDEASLRKWLDALKAELSQRPIQDLYEMCETIGQGKFSVVYRAIERETQEVVAIKVVHKSRMNAEEKELLRSEMCIMRMLRHPHVIYLKRIVSSREALYIVLEYVPGGELFRVISRQQGLRAKSAAAPGTPPAAKPLLEETEVHRLTVQLLKTLAYLHKSGIVHRDLKPENILLTDSQDISRADVKIADFGLSCLCGPNEVLKQPCGTLVYAAPEVLTMKGYSHKVDVWSVGVVVYLLLCGKLPFPALRNLKSLDDLDAFFKLKYEGPAWSAVSPTCRDFLSKLLVVDPEARFTSQQALGHIWIKNPAAVIGE